MRAIAEEAFAMVREYKGSHSGEHGDGIVRSEFHETDVRRAPRRAPSRRSRTASIRTGLLNPGKIVRAPKFDDRDDFPLSARTTASTTIDDRARLVGLSRRRRRFPGRGRDVQQQRRLPQARGRRDVPVLSRHARREGRHARPRQYAAAGDHRPARPRCAHVRRDGGDDEALRLLQGLPARMPDRRRHGAHEDRGAGARAPRSTGSRCTTGWSAICRATRRSAARLSWLLNLRDVVPGAAVLSERIAGFSARRTLPRWRRDWFRDGEAGYSLPRLRGRDGVGAARGAVAAETAPLPSEDGGGERIATGEDDPIVRRAVRRHLQPLFRAGKSPCGRGGAARRRLPGHGGDAGGRHRAAAVLRPHLPGRRPGRGGAPRGGADHRGAGALGLRAACRSSAWSRVACSLSATKSPP